MIRPWRGGQLPEPAYVAAYTAGQAMTLEEAMAYALFDSHPGPTF